jgi:hypothetical protein
MKLLRASPLTPAGAPFESCARAPESCAARKGSRDTRGRRTEFSSIFETRRIGLQGILMGKVSLYD